MSECKQLDDYRKKVLEDLKKELKTTVCENFQDYIYQQACYNEKIMRGLRFYKPKSIKINIEWEIEDD